MGYPESSLAMEAPARARGLRAGDRAPDVPVTGAAGQPTRLFQLFKGTHWTLLGRGGPGDLRDDGGHLRDAYALAVGDWVLVRPDGYVGAIVAAAHVQALEGYLQGVGRAAAH